MFALLRDGRHELNQPCKLSTVQHLFVVVFSNIRLPHISWLFNFAYIWLRMITKGMLPMLQYCLWPRYILVTLLIVNHRLLLEPPYGNTRGLASIYMPVCSSIQPEITNLCIYIYLNENAWYKCVYVLCTVECYYIAEKVCIPPEIKISSLWAL